MSYLIDPKTIDLVRIFHKAFGVVTNNKPTILKALQTKRRKNGMFTQQFVR